MVPLKDTCNSHREEATIKCLECDEKLCTECVCGDDHRGHPIKTLKTLFNESLGEAIEAQDNLKTYSKVIDESEYSLKMVKILKDDSISNALYSIIGQVKNNLHSQAQRVSTSFNFIDKKISEGTREKETIESLLKECNKCLANDMSFDSVNKLKEIAEKIKDQVSNQKQLELSKTAETYKFKSIAIEKPPIEVEFNVPMDAILVPDNKKYHCEKGEFPFS